MSELQSTLVAVNTTQVMRGGMGCKGERGGREGVRERGREGGRE